MSDRIGKRGDRVPDEARATRESGVTVAVVTQFLAFGEALAAELASDDVHAVAVDERSGSPVDACLQLPADVVLVDIDGRRSGGLALLRELVGALPRARVLALTATETPRLLRSVLTLGGAGAVSVRATVEEVRSSVRAALAGTSTLTGEHLTALLEGTRASSDHGRRLRQLTAREREVAAELATGASTEEIAARLGVTVNTARTHVQRVLAKLGVHSRVEAAAIAARHGLVARR